MYQSILTCFALFLLLLPPVIARADEPATVTLVYHATLSYDGQRNENRVVDFVVKYYEDNNGRQGDQIDRIPLAPGDQVEIQLKDAGDEHRIGTWQAVVKYRLNSVIHRQPIPLDGGDPEWAETNPPREVRVNEKLGDGRITVGARIELEDDDAREHSFGQGTDHADMGTVNEPTELQVSGTVDRRKPGARDFTRGLKEGSVQGNITEINPGPNKNDWYELTITITRVQAP